ncbi:MAG: DUF2628 domain-containing protein [Pseudochelatococcus sp.]|jgi:hypothetical protein|uniref:DUF2628 domain-containing protein n=1 Tax=Pseudochelatococcus sp. TaxID=2020869 RepID=UPI003D94496A
MAVYTFHVPAGASPGDRLALERAVVVRDGFSWGALIFQFLWCLWNRLWLVAAGFLAVSLALAFGLEWAGLPERAAGLAGVLLALLFAFEANGLRRWTLERRGLALRGVVVADDAEAAERRAFAIWLAGRDADEPPAGGAQADGAQAAGGVAAKPQARPYPHPRAPVRDRRDEGVIGLFPPAEEPR